MSTEDLLDNAIDEASDAQKELAVFRDQYDRHIARHIEEKRRLRSVSASLLALLSEALGAWERLDPEGLEYERRETMRRVFRGHGLGAGACTCKSAKGPLCDFCAGSRSCE